MLINSLNIPLRYNYLSIISALLFLTGDVIRAIKLCWGVARDGRNNIGGYTNVPIVSTIEIRGKLNGG